MLINDNALTVLSLAVGAYMALSITRSRRGATRRYRWLWECHACGLRYSSAGLLVRHVDINHPKENPS